MDGPSESSTPTPIQQKMDNLEAALEQFEQQAGLHKLGEPDTDTASLLNLSKTVLRGMTAEECSENAALLAQYSFYLQRVSNAEKTRVDWCKQNILAIVRPRLHQQKGWSFEERLTLAIQENDVARKLEATQVKCETRVNRIAFLASKAEVMSRRLSELANIKQRKNY